MRTQRNNFGPAASPAAFARRDSHPAASPGFTLVELLVVISIIAILVAMLAPSVTMAIKLANVTHTQARVTNLSNALGMYASSNDNLYPGQRWMDNWTDSSNNACQGLLPKYKTGSAILAHALYTKYDSTGKEIFPTSNYEEYKNDYTLTLNGVPDSLSDGFDTNRPILYFSARVGETALDKEFLLSDNATYLTKPGENVPATFQTFITDKKLGTRAVHGGQFLLIGAGLDQVFFTSDDVKDF